MKIGNWKYRCAIYRTEGYEKPVLTEIYNRKCYYTMVTGKEQPMQFNIENASVYNAKIIMYYLPDVDEKMIVGIDGKYYEITSVIHDDNKVEMTLFLSLTKGFEDTSTVNLNYVANGGLVVG